MIVALVNALSLFRLAAAFFVPYFAVTGRWNMALAFIACGFLSDLIDGPLARKYHAETKAGKFVDLISDIVFDWGMVIGMILIHRISWWFAMSLLVAIFTLRTPVLLSQRFFKLGAVSILVYSPGMLYLITTTYAYNVFGRGGLIALVALMVPITGIIIYLKRDRVMSDFNQARKSFFG
jgi:cardiolipin synthase